MSYLPNRNWNDFFFGPKSVVKIEASGEDLEQKYKSKLNIK